MADSISAYSGGDSLVEMNLPRFSLSGSIGRPTFPSSLIISNYLRLIIKNNQTKQATKRKITIMSVTSPSVVAFSTAN